MFVRWVCLGQSLVGGVRCTLKGSLNFKLALLEMTARKTRSTRTQKKTDSDSGLPSPPYSNGDKTNDNDAAGPSSTMISPPPEEDGGRRSKVRVGCFVLT